MNFLFGTMLALRISFTLAILAIFIALLMRVIHAWERGVLLRLGKIIQEKGPGLVVLIPFLDRLEKIDMREFLIEVPRFHAMLKDHHSVIFELRASLKVENASRVVEQCRDYHEIARVNTFMIIREYLSQIGSDQPISISGDINAPITSYISNRLAHFGLVVIGLELIPVTSL